MKLGLSYGIILMLLTGCHTNDVFLQRHSALQLLSRIRRANRYAEEIWEGNLERECVEETCSKEEAREIFEDDTKTDVFRKHYITGCSPILKDARTFKGSQKEINKLRLVLRERKEEIYDIENKLMEKLGDCLDSSGANLSQYECVTDTYFHTLHRWYLHESADTVGKKQKNYRCWSTELKTADGGNTQQLSVSKDSTYGKRIFSLSGDDYLNVNFHQLPNTP